MRLSESGTVTAASSVVHPLRHLTISYRVHGFVGQLWRCGSGTNATSASCAQSIMETTDIQVTAFESA